MILVIADDLSGAAELAGIAAVHGLRSEVHTRLDLKSRADLIAINTESRSLEPEQASERVFRIFEKARALNPEWVFKKTDSALRGNIASELQALAAATSKQRILFIPANPSKHRVIVDGEYQIEGLPITESVFATDPEHPITQSRITEMIKPFDRTRIHSISRSQPSPVEGIIIPDVSTPSDIRHHTTDVDEHTLPAGAADFFTALLKERVLSKPTKVAPLSSSNRLFICGSLASWEAGFERNAKSHQIPIHTIEDFADHFEAIKNRLKNREHAALAIGRSLKTGGKNRITDSNSLLQRLIKAAKALIDHQMPTQIFIDGGATASALFTLMDWHQFKVVPSSLIGVGCLMPNRSRSTPTLFVKPGSYPWPKKVWEPPTR
ncbi:four-carbon acid sugar kinase family protein [bacterium]|jgi:D-threonate/D-erythronate kinase|nr:four-carbon acid sugar kinase family protein [Verrucomicrobiota bacterium]MDA7632474.1 four-carbon acid sugar kinase family protein [bacterium]MDB4745594.1 four-carbon acid sugar kinase family protein [Verrucomicrobiota bacterium]